MENGALSKGVDNSKVTASFTMSVALIENFNATDASFEKLTQNDTLRSHMINIRTKIGKW